MSRTTVDLRRGPLALRNSPSAVHAYRSSARSDTSSEDENPLRSLPPPQHKITSAPTFDLKALTAPQSTFTSGPFTTTVFTTTKSTPQPTAATPSATISPPSTTTDSKSHSKMSDSADKRELAAHLSMLRSVSGHQEEQNELAGSPVFTMPVLQHAKSSFSQYGFLAGNADMLDRITATDADTDSLPANLDPRIFFNISTPSSAFICGSQGSGKSHTLSCLLENCLLKSSVSKLDNPLSGLVFHYDSFISDLRGTPCEAAHLSSNPKIKVRVLCSPSNVQTIERTYEGLNVKIEPLKINQNDLNTKRMLDLMAVNTEDGKMPLYLHEITRILRDMRVLQQQTNGSFNYAEFKRQVSLSPMTPAQQAPLTQRLDTLESFMPKSQTEVNNNQTKNRKNVGGNDWSIKAGYLTIVDLSCPCVTSEGACALFNMCLSLFLEQKAEIGRVIALDEAHKYMNAGSEASTLTNTLLSSIRLQRHLGTRAFISTQEPSISPKLLDLCSITIVHRFTSPDWLRCLRSHLAALDNDDSLSTNSKLKLNNVFNQIVKLKVGQALLFAPSAIIGVLHTEDQESGKTTYEIQRLGIEYLRVKIRDRVTTDGGRSVLALGADSPFAAQTPSASTGASLFGGSTASKAPSSGFTSTAPATVSKFGIPASSTTFGGKSAPGPKSTNNPKGSFSTTSIFSSSTVFGGGAAAAHSTGFFNSTISTPSTFNAPKGIFSANPTSTSMNFSGAIFGTQSVSATPVFGANGFTNSNHITPLFGTASQVPSKAEHSDSPLSTTRQNPAIDRAATTKPAISIKGSFAKSTAPLPDTPGTQGFVFPFVEKEPGSTRGHKNSFNTISFLAPWNTFSFEELRLGDYGRGMRGPGRPL
ncbi:hypothetical protein ACEPPN_004343 [Leptodophora sp. 'Broadleaf-Isolate-01']